MLGDIHGIVQAAVGAAMAQHNQENQQLRKENNALAEENNALAERLKSLKVTDGSNKTSKPVGRRTNKSSKQPQSAKVAGNPSVPLKTPDKKKNTGSASTPQSDSSRGGNPNRMMMEDVPESFLKTRDCIYTHIRILWDMMEEKAIPKIPDMNTLKEFQQRFANADQIAAAAENSASPVLITEGEVTTLRDLKMGQIIVSKKIIHVEDFFFKYTKAVLARLGIRKWAPDLEDSPDSLYNEACRVAAIKSFRQIAVNGAYKFANCNLQFLNDFDLLIRAYNHYVFFLSKNKYTKEKKNPGSLGQELDRKAISHARGRLRKARVSFAKNHNLPKRYKRVLADLSAHSDDEYNDQHSCYIIKTVAFRSANANKFFRRLDEEMKKEYEGPRDQRRIRRVPDVPQPSIFKALPKQLPLDFFDPTWFNNSMASRKRKAADVMSAAFLPDADKSLLGTVQAIESMTDEDFNEKYLLKCQKLYDITHAFYISEDEEEDIDNDDGESEVLVLGESRNTSDEDNLDDEDMDYDDANEQVEDQDGGNDERNEDEDHGDEARAQRYQMMVLDDANW
ncbi:hypothetical protein Pst134EA_025403 [Puccinia striiformis f. sp. tritici]|uniref:hypothetical protein n=1 Tax=Puccinia striiformis f. sp. tritici TaxID=168172 RepID=UPI002007C763|nr:hypothetical protein Pst134EA_025403 [Puccinia striiformis f. sp. tritici]KAH9451449.1 hypothetical protein Pst134EA_025403 [Puccinia striiformis f. sp. tritici]